MKLNLKMTVAAAALAVAAGPVLAGGVVEPAPAPAIIPVAPAGTDWTGFSIGAQLGYIDVDTDGAAELDGDDILYGVRAYYDYDFGNFILGGGVQYDFTSVDLDGAAEVDAVLRIGARAGVDLNQNWIYGTAGYARVETDAGAVDPGDSDGFFVGAGYEVFVTDAVTLGAEVLYHEFEDFDIDGLDADATTASVSVNFRF